MLKSLWKMVDPRRAVLKGSGRAQADFGMSPTKMRLRRSVTIFPLWAGLILALWASPLGAVSLGLGQVAGPDATLNAAQFYGLRGRVDGATATFTAARICNLEPFETCGAGVDVVSIAGINYVPGLDNIAWLAEFERPVSEFSFRLTPSNDDAHISYRVGNLAAQLPSPDPDGPDQPWFIRVGFDQPQSSATILFRSERLGDWSIEEANVSPIPIPASGWLLLGALAFYCGFNLRRNEIS